MRIFQQNNSSYSSLLLRQVCEIARADEEWEAEVRGFM